MISNISMWEELLLEMERPGRMLKWIYVPGHAGLEGSDTTHRLAMEGMCLSTLWALPHTAFSRRKMTHKQPMNNRRALQRPYPQKIYMQCRKPL